MTDLLIATTNPGKLREIRPILGDLPLRLLTLGDLPAPIPEPEEDGATFAENARIKARAYARASGLLTVAEDSGLAVDALGGRPGIHSARYPGATYPEKFANLWRELAPFPRPWTAHYVCAVAVARPDGTLVHECDGRVDGEIATAPSGPRGFGYDPIFFVPDYQATFGEVDDDRKAAIAHRGMAFRVLRDLLKINLNPI